MRTTVFFLINIQIMSLLLVACSSNLVTATSDNSAQQNVEINASPAFQTPTPKPKMTVTIVPTLTSTVNPTQTNIPTLTLPPTLAPSTWTPLPVISTEEIPNVVQELVDNNGFCRLPCWWGITPGVASWQEARHFLSAFAVITGDERDSIIDVQVPSPIDISHIAYLEQKYEIVNNVVTSIRIINYKELATWYFLPNILKNYGRPTEIGIYTFQESDGSQPTGILLFYADQGMMIEYVGQKRIEIVDDKVQICPSGTNNFMYLWSSDIQMDFEQAIDRFLEPENQGLPFPLPLEQATGMEIEMFYQIYQDPNSEICIETPVSLWPKY